MMNDIARALGQLTDPRLLGVLVRSVLFSVIVLIVLYLPFAGLAWLLETLVGDWIGVDLEGWLGGTLGFLAAGLWLWMASILMFPIAAIIVSFFLDRICSAVEAKHYPQLPAPRDGGLKEAASTAIGFTLALIGLNLAALLVYPFLGPFAPLLFWAVNGYLIGREYFEVVAIRRVPPARVKALRQAHVGAIFGLGLLIVVPLTVPILNLLIPVIGVAAFTHFYHRVKAAG